MESTLPISVIILAHQGDQRLYATVESARWAREIILVWAGKKADLPVADSAQIHVVLVPSQITDFAAIRNKAIKIATFDWVFLLDSDEVLVESAARTLGKIIHNPLIDGARVRRIDVFLQKELHHGEVGHVTFVRLFRRQKAHFTRRVHETLDMKGHIVNTDIVLYHFAHPSISDFLRKIIWYISLEQVERSEYHERFRLGELVFFPPAKFVQNFIFRLGFLDGWHGLVYAVMMSIHSFGVRALLYESHHSQENA